MSERTLPPVTELGVVSMALIVAGGISIASQLSGDVPLTLPVILLAASALVMAANVVALAGRCSPTASSPRCSSSCSSTTARGAGSSSS